MIELLPQSPANHNDLNRRSIMAVEHTSVLSLLGKNISFVVSYNFPENFKNQFPDFCNKSGVVQSVIIDLQGDHGIFVDDEYYSLSQIEVTLTA